jgi:hypothetical protein
LFGLLAASGPQKPEAQKRGASFGAQKPSEAHLTQKDGKERKMSFSVSFLRKLQAPPPQSHSSESFSRSPTVNPRTRAPGAPPPLTSLVPPPRCKPRRQLERGAPARSGPRRQLTRRAAPPGAETTSRQEPNQAAPPGPRSSPTQEPSGPRAGAALAADPAAPLGAAHAGAPAERSPTG